MLAPFRMRSGFEGPRYDEMLAVLDALSPAQRMKLISLSIGNANSDNSAQSQLQQVLGEKKRPTANWATQAGELATGESAHHTAVPGSLVSARLPDEPRVSLRLVFKDATRDNHQRVTSLAGASLVRVEVLDAPARTQ